MNWLLGYLPLEIKLIITVSADLKLLERSSMSRNDMLLGGVNWLLGYRPLEIKLIITVSVDLKLLERSSMSRNDIYNFSNQKNIIVVELGTILCKLRPFNGYNASLPLVKYIFLAPGCTGFQFFLTDR